MDLSISATSAAYLPMQAYAQQAALAGYPGPTPQQNTTVTADTRGSRQSSATRAELSPASPEAQKAQEEAARRKDPSAEVSRSPGFKFEFQDSQQIMKVHNAKGVLIYQVPSKGQLALIEAEDNAQRLGQQLRLTA